MYFIADMCCQVLLMLYSATQYTFLYAYTFWVQRFMRNLECWEAMESSSMYLAFIYSVDNPVSCFSLQG